VPAKAANVRSRVYLAVVALAVAGAAGVLFALPALRKPESAVGAKPVAAIQNLPSGRTGFFAPESDRLDPRQVNLLKAAAASICNVAKDGAGKVNDALLKGTVLSQLGGLFERMAEVGPVPTMSHDDFQGLTREATAIASAGGPDCETQLLPKMLARLAAPPSAASVNSGACGIAVNGNATGNSVSCGAPPGVKP